MPSKHSGLCLDASSHVIILVVIFDLAELSFFGRKFKVSVSFYNACVESILFPG